MSEDGGPAVQVCGVRLQDEDVQDVQGDQEDAAGLLQVQYINVVRITPRLNEKKLVKTRGHSL